MAGLRTFEAKALAKDEAHRKKLNEEVERRKAQEQDKSRGENIGWTKLSEEEVDEQCEAAQKSFGVYVLGFNDCQSFLRRFAKLIIQQPEDCALDFLWFEKNIQTPYHQLQLVPADENIKRFQLYMQTTLYGVTGATIGAAAGTYDHQYQPQEPMTKRNNTEGANANSSDKDKDNGCCDCDSGCC
ncbi:hypothetical protein BKA59DRAFT_460464 [Fusarium tricinctum]|uniref:Uncharacterized protein n=1 Tax=Fusarium tricinctum TaxID=61284 RepID=A0A8K0RMT2_9HYPO|nr:hypothetical protein BKA59DRAFT_460464 [Fusarium tricinctum]